MRFCTWSKEGDFAVQKGLLGSISNHVWLCVTQRRRALVFESKYKHQHMPSQYAKCQTLATRLSMLRPQVTSKPSGPEMKSESHNACNSNMGPVSCMRYGSQKLKRHQHTQTNCSGKATHRYIFCLSIYLSVYLSLFSAYLSIYPYSAYCP